MVRNDPAICTVAGTAGSGERALLGTCFRRFVLVITIAVTARKVVSTGVGHIRDFFYLVLK